MSTAVTSGTSSESESPRAAPGGSASSIRRSKCTWGYRLSSEERSEVIVVGGGQAGLVAGYHLSRAQVPFLILDASSRVGEPWRRRWDSLLLFTVARYSSLPGLPFPGDPEHFPGKDEVADYPEDVRAHACATGSTRHA